MLLHVDASASAVPASALATTTRQQSSSIGMPRAAAFTVLAWHRSNGIANNVRPVRDEVDEERFSRDGVVPLPIVLIHDLAEKLKRHDRERRRHLDVGGAPVGIEEFAFHSPNSLASACFPYPPVGQLCSLG